MIEYSTFVCWIKHRFYFPVEIMFLSHPIPLKKILIFKIQLMIGVQMVNVCLTQNISRIKNIFLQMTHRGE